MIIKQKYYKQLKIKKMKKLILILTILAFGFGCKKDTRCVIGKWHHVKSVCNGIIQTENENYIITITENSFTYGKSNELFDNIIITDNSIGSLQYSCDGNTLRIKYNYCISDNSILNDGSFEKNYEEYKI
jgi:hypothetical protein